jgi:uncharacterized protein YbjT (DUF2867 family)
VSSPRYLVTGAGGRIGSVSRLVVERLLDRGAAVRAMVRTDDARAEALRGLGAEVVVADLTRPAEVGAAIADIDRVFFSMSVSPEYLEATAVVCATARAAARIELLVNMSQMTVAEMSARSTEESHQQRMHWLAEQIADWSGVPTAHVRPTVFLENPLFTIMAAQSVRERDELALPFGEARTSPIAAADVADVVTALLTAKESPAGEIYELTGPEVLTVEEIADRYSRALGRPITAIDPPYDEWLGRLRAAHLPAHVEDHIATMARLHRAGRYDRFTDTVERITGHRPRTIEDQVRQWPR